MYVLQNHHHRKSASTTSQLPIFLCVMKTCRIYSLSYCQIYNTVFTMVAMLYITPPGLTDFITGMLYLLTTFTHSPLPSGTTDLYIHLSFVNVNHVDTSL